MADKAQPLSAEEIAALRASPYRSADQDVARLLATLDAYTERSGIDVERLARALDAVSADYDATPGFRGTFIWARDIAAAYEADPR